MIQLPMRRICTDVDTCDFWNLMIACMGVPEQVGTALLVYWQESDSALKPVCDATRL